MRNRVLRLVPILAALAANSARPAAGTAPDFRRTLAQLLRDSGITESGYIAASYFHSSGYNTYHAFDTSHDTFQLDQAGLTLAHQPKRGFGALIDLIAGQDAKIVAAAESAPAAGSSPFDVLQAYVRYATGPLTVQAGKFTTLAGAEVIAPTGDTNFSRSLLFFAEPLTHTGIRTTWRLRDTVSLTVGINNGWNYTRIDSDSKTGEFGIALSPDGYLSLTAQAYVGRDPVVGANRTFFDTVATYNATSSLSFVLSYDWGRQASSAAIAGGDWNGVAGYINYRLCRRWRLSLRGETLDDRGGFILGAGVSQRVAEGTVTVGYDPVARFELRVEGRYDSSSRRTFLESTGTRPDGAAFARFSDHQSEAAVQAVYRF
jgi:hypothetical protein